VISSYTEAVRGAVGSSIKISATPVPMAEIRQLDLLPMSLFRDEEDMRVVVNCFDLEKSPGVNGEETEDPESWRRQG
jgi:hypothetical protein